jgi:F0F1-type ATP synthase epsilon subunit
MFKLTIYDIKTTATIFKELVSNVVLPSQDGQLSVWDFHQPMIASLKEGKIEVDKNNLVSIKNGVARAGNNELVIFVKK